jgi:hypothetical protein
VLFDLRGAGRRRVVKVVYVTLAFLMGGGLVLFGIGGDVSGGLVDAITERSGGADVGSDRFRQQEERLVAKLRANPDDAPSLAELARVRFQLAGLGENYDPQTNQYTNEGKAQLRRAADAWQRYLALDPEQPSDRVAGLMVQAYAALDNAAEAVRAQEIVAEARESPGAYSTLAVYAYEAGQIRKGDLAREKALELTPEDMRESLRGQLDAAKAQAMGGQGGQGGQQGGQGE